MAQAIKVEKQPYNTWANIKSSELSGLLLGFGYLKLIYSLKSSLSLNMFSKQVFQLRAKIKCFVEKTHET